MTTLAEYADIYVRLLDGEPSYLDQLRWAISRFEKHHSRTILISELTPELINDYLSATRETLAPQTRINRRNMLLRLWRHASTNPALEHKPPRVDRDRIVSVKRRKKPPKAWSLDDVRTLLSVAGSLKGTYSNRVAKADYWRAWILASWSTGMRRCDLMSLRREDIPVSGRLVVVQQKTGRHVVGQLTPEAIAAIDVLCGGRPGVIFPLWCRLSTWRIIARRLVTRAGIGLSIGHLRHSAGTAVENANPGKGPQFLGNTPQVFYQHYYDRRLQADLPVPGSIAE